MKLSAASRFRSARLTIERQRPYALKTLEVLGDIAARAPLDGDTHPLLAIRRPNRVWLVVLASNRGLAGAFNVRVCREAEATWLELKAAGAEVSIVTFGQKALHYFSRRGANIRRDLSGPFDKLGDDGSAAARFGRSVGQAFEAEELDACYLVYTEHQSVFIQRPIVWRLLPITPVALDEDEQGDFCYEPNKQALLAQLLPMYIGVETYRAFQESIASESAARMVAMDAANKNAAELVEKLTLRYNRCRQEEITRELIEITGFLAENPPDHGHSRWHREVQALGWRPLRVLAAKPGRPEPIEPEYAQPA